MEDVSMRSRLFPAKIHTKLPLIAIVAQGIVILLLLVEPAERYAPVVQQQCRPTNSELASEMAPRSKDIASLTKEEVGAALTYGTEGNVEIDILQNALLIQGPMITVRVPRHPNRIIFNRVPKCGSSTLKELTNQMAKRHNFTFSEATEYMRFYLDEYWMEKFVQRIRAQPTPLIYERHIHYFEAEKYGMETPVFINIIRDPLERMISWYYFRRYQSGHQRNLPIAQRIRTFDECVLGNHSECMQHGGFSAEEGFFKIIPFFCGQQKMCREPTQDALIQAIKNVKKHYLVVGVLEDFEGFIEVLEFLLPDYFAGAKLFYAQKEKDLKDRHRTKYKLPVSKEVEKIMRARLFKEYQFYMFAQKRFRRLLEAVRAAKMDIVDT